MTDRELLELAAKAAGIQVEEWNASAMTAGGFGAYLTKSGLGHETWWNPMLDDAQALRLAVKLHIRVQPATDDQYAFAVVVGNEEGVAEGCIFDGDPYSATRRAIVRAAAEIGKGMT